MCVDEREKRKSLCSHVLSVSKLINQPIHQKIVICEIGSYCTDNACCADGKTLAECGATKRLGVIPAPVNKDSSSPSSFSACRFSKRITRNCHYFLCCMPSYKKNHTKKNLYVFKEKSISQ